MSQASLSSSLATQQATLQNHTNKAMIFLILLGMALLYQFRSVEDLLPFLSVSVILWINAILLIRGFRGVLEGHNGKMLVIGVQILFVFAGIALVTQLFKGQHIPLLLGSTTWIIALFWASTQRKIVSET